VAKTVIITVLFGGLLANMPSAAAAQSRRLLDVPYVTQTPALCGGAAVAMVLRYWGARDVFPQDFSSLVVAREGGIPANVLSEAVRARQWRADVVAVTDESPRLRLQQEVDQGRPIIALIEVAPRTFHYVVIVALTASDVVVHDPARAPFMVMTWAGFDRAWVASERWALRILPVAATETVRPPAPVSIAAESACTQLVAHAVAVAHSGAAGDAERALVSATQVCPAEPSAWRELAGWRFTQSRWTDAAALADRAVALAPDDAYARELLGTARYLAGDTAGALAAWGPLGGPRLDGISVQGLTRTPHPILIGATGLQPRQLLTPQRFARAERRVRAVPIVASARVIVVPQADGLASVNVALVERPVTPVGWLALGRIAGRAAVLHTVDVEVAGALRRAESVTVAWRWSAPRPLLAMTVAAPAPRGASGIVTLDATGEHQTYQGGSRESRRRVALSWSDWGSHRLLWRGGLALDRFDDRGHLSADGGADLRLAADHIAVGSHLAAWRPHAGGAPFGTGRLTFALRTTTDPDVAAWHVWTALDVASRGAPRALWAGAGVGDVLGARLRAHQLVASDVVSGTVFGRVLATSTVEYRRPVGRWLTNVFGVATFVDVAQAWRGPSGIVSRLEVDAGVGVTARGPGAPGGVRLDLARGLRRGGWRASLSWGRSWPD
jgi:hypothetical protein